MLKIYKATPTLDGYNLAMPYTSNKDEAEVIVVGGKQIDLGEYPQLKGIFKTGVGTDNLPFDEAAKRSIRIQLPSENTKEVIYDETASFTCFLIMRGLYSEIGSFSAWTKHNRDSISSKRLLIMGTGKIGSRVTKRMQSFMQVDTYDPLYNNPDELDILIKNADCISLHMPLNNSTKDFFNNERLASVKDGGLLINTSRGPVVNEDALFDELSANRIRAAFDVFWEEPYKGKLADLPESRFIRTPHVASTCKQFLDGLSGDFALFYNELDQNNIHER